MTGGTSWFGEVRVLAHHVRREENSFKQMTHELVAVWYPSRKHQEGLGFRLLRKGFRRFRV